MYTEEQRKEWGKRACELVDRLAKGEMVISELTPEQLGLIIGIMPGHKDWRDPILFEDGMEMDDLDELVFQRSGFGDGTDGWSMLGLLVTEMVAIRKKWLMSDPEYRADWHQRVH